MLKTADIVFLLIHYRWRWSIPLVLAVTAALAYAMFKPDSWQATQAIVLRDEAVSSLGRPGEFDQVEDMKHAQETILQLARSREVIQAALQQLGPREIGWFGLGASNSSWPSKDDIASARKKISVDSPGGTEFGTTEIMYLSVEAETPERAQKLNQLICQQLEEELGHMRNGMAKSLVEELAFREQQAGDSLAQVTLQLSQMEQEVGTDLAELRILNEVGAGNGNLREQMVQIKGELRQALDQRQESSRLIEILTAAQANPGELIATPNQLLDSQPALRRLKDGLIDAQLRSAQLQGIRTDLHPDIVAARQAAEEIRAHLHQEIALAIRGLNAEQTVSQGRIEQLEQQLADVSSRMTRLASLRAGYDNLINEVREKNLKLTRIRADLADAQSSVSAANTTSLITKVSRAEISDYPVGPSRKAIVMAGAVGGLALGLGIVLLTAPSASPLDSTAAANTSSNPAQVSSAASPGHGLTLKEALFHLARRNPSRN